MTNRTRLLVALAFTSLLTGCTDFGSSPGDGGETHPVECADFGSSPGDGASDSGSPPGTETVVLVATRDNTLFESADGSLSSGAGESLLVGRTGTNDGGNIRRTLVAFAVADSVPAGATVTEATLTLHLVQTSPDAPSGADPICVRRVTRDWGEGTSISPAGQGAAATPGDATWIHARYDTDAWAVPGGDFASTISAQTQVGAWAPPPDDASNFHSWTGPGLVADVQAMLDDPRSDHGWIVRGEERVLHTAKRFHSREVGTPMHRPTLTIRYRPAATP